MKRILVALSILTSSSTLLAASNWTAEAQSLLIDRVLKISYASPSTSAQNWPNTPLLQDTFTADSWDEYAKALAQSGNQALVTSQRLTTSYAKPEIIDQYTVGDIHYLNFRTQVSFKKSDQTLYAKQDLVFKLIVVPNADHQKLRVGQIRVENFHDPSKGFHHPGCQLHKKSG